MFLLLSGQPSPRPRKILVLLVTLVIVILGFAATIVLVSNFAVFTNSFAAGQPGQRTTPIQHIIVIMQENHAFDNMFGAFPNLDPAFNESSLACEQYSLTNP